MSVDDNSQPNVRKVDDQIDQMGKQLVEGEEQLKKLEEKLHEAEKALHRRAFRQGDDE